MIQNPEPCHMCQWSDNLCEIYDSMREPQFF